MAPKLAPTFKLNNGKEVPAFGLGTWKSKPGEVTQAVKDAIDIGYRHIDCAYIYGNEKEVGAAVSAKIGEGVVKREDLFITSKLWNSFHKPELIEGVLKESLANLCVEYLDLYLIHWPQAYKENEELFPTDADGKIKFSDVDYVDTWKQLEKMVEQGFVKSIGLSNFNKKQIERVLGIATIKPVCLQIECHPYLNQNRLINFCNTKEIIVTAYSPLGSPDRPWAKPDDPNLLEDPKLAQISKHYGKSVAQVLLRYQFQRGVVAIPKSVTKSRIAENFDIFDFELSEADLFYMNTFDCNGRLCPMTASLGHKHHPFENDEF